MHYYVLVKGSSVGPMTEEQLWAYNVNSDSSISTDGINWKPLYTYPELMEGMRRSCPNEGTADGPSKKTLCGIFAIILGGLGIQYFILGKVGAGIVNILITLVTCGLWSIVTLIQGILMLTMSNEDFKRKYVDSTSFMPLF